MASTSANSVSRLMENPATDMKANVPIIETKMEMVGISVERTSCKKTYTTSTTSRMAMASETTTSRMEA